jgi:cation-transporting ATPase E
VTIEGTTVELTGLTSADVAERIAEGKTNAFTQASSRSAWSIIRANTLTLFNGIIAGCFLVLLIIGRWQDALFGFSAIANAVIGSVQEFRAKRALDRLALLNAPNARVLRDGTETEIPVAEVVLDDLLILRAGDQVPADGVVVQSTGLQLDESMLTGEADAIDKVNDAEVLSGSIVVAGSGLARADKVGADSFANRFADEARRFSLVRSELRAGINRVLKWVAWIVGPIALLVLNSQMMVAGGWAEAIEGGTWQTAAVGAIASIVAMIPLGLVLMTSIAFAVGAVKLSSQNVLVQELPAVEGLARVDVVCLDKTGTLTEGDIVFGEAHPLGAAALGWEDVLAWYGVQPDSNATAQCLAEPYPAVPDATPSGRIAFSSARKWSAVGFDDGPAGSWVLGGPEMVFPRATDELTEADRLTLMEQVAELAGGGMRTLVLAHAAEQLDVEGETLPRSLRPTVLLTFRERIRSDAAETLAYFAAQGVAVRIISGDNPQTVAAIARNVGLDAPHGYDARELPDDDALLPAILDENIVFGRVTPEQKKRLVIALKTQGHTVAMTGDGVNDALAIKEADIGIAMNSGSAATKAVARLILLDGKFSHLPHVVAEGRQVIANIERVSMLFLTKTAYATGLAIVFGALVFSFPFLPRQLSVIDGLTIGLPSFFLALMPNVQRYQPGFLRRSLSFAIPAGIVVTAALAVYSWLSTSAGIGQPELRTGATLMLTIIGLWILVVLARPVTILKALVIGAMMIGLILVYSIPIVSDFLQLTDPGLTTALLVMVISALAIGAIECVRFAHIRYVRRLAARRIAPSVPST